MEKTKKTFRERKNTTQFQLTLRFIGLLVSAVLLLSLAIMGITIAELYEATKEQTVLVEESLKNGQQKTIDDWQKTLAGSVSKDNSPYLIRVGLESGEVIFSSDDATEVYDEFSTLKQFILFDHVLWTSEMEPYYHISFQTGQTKVTILVDMEDQFEVIDRIFSLTVFLTLIVIGIGSLVTYRFSRKISGALVYMDQEITQLESASAAQQLTVPKTPLEVQNIAKSFNLLLVKQHASLKREQQFVTDASHELRTPLAAIRGHVNLIKRRGKTHSQVIPTSLEYIDKESKRMEILVGQMLTLGRLEKQLETETIDLSTLINQTINELKAMMPQSLNVQIEEKIIIEGRPEHFYQITRNLLENAQKYTDDTGTISVKLFSKVQDIYLLIEDSGIGISNEAKSKVFERFYRVDQSRSSQIPGTGIGLAIVKELVELYQGNITVTDVTPTGTRFTLIFAKTGP